MGWRVKGIRSMVQSKGSLHRIRLGHIFLEIEISTPDSRPRT